MATSPKSPRKETALHLKAFAYWLTVGADLHADTLELVAKKFDRSVRTIKYWWQWFGWRDRADVDSILEVDKNRDKLLARLNEEAIKSKQELLEISSKAIEQFKLSLLAHKVPIRKVMDFVNLARLHLAMQGEPTGDETNITIITAIPRPRQEVGGGVFQDGTGEIITEMLPPHEE